mmetsp:Transcript_121919/g.190421  ORF Transcript_121919/g.190421 Transcript_121919/m.190421 type:complete len:119 (+) Transcript_121919:184-540(+)
MRLGGEYQTSISEERRDLADHISAIVVMECSDTEVKWQPEVFNETPNKPVDAHRLARSSVVVVIWDLLSPKKGHSSTTKISIHHTRTGHQEQQGVESPVARSFKLHHSLWSRETWWNG